jgi:hypothetical protein
VQVGLEERENLTVTWNASIAIRTFCVTLLAAILALVLVATLAEDADARKKRRKKGTATFSCVWDNATGACQPTFHHNTGKRFAPPDHFSCSPGHPFLIPSRDYDWDPPNIQPPKRIDGYICEAEGSVKMVSIGAGPPVTQAAKFDLNDVLDRDEPSWGAGQPPPPGPLASPDLFKCDLIPNSPPADSRTTNDFSCEFAENQQTCVFTMNELVATNVDEVDDDNKTVEEDLDRWDPKDQVDSLQTSEPFNDLFLPLACHPGSAAVPHAVPAGADAAGQGSAPWLFGLALAASGATVGTVLIARRRIRHDS